MSNTKHAQTPWRYDATIRQMLDKGGRVIADTAYSNFTSNEDKANAAFIVRACNSHDQLVTALRDGRVAIDVLMSQLIEVDPSFLPTKSAAWPALVAIKNALDVVGA